MARILGLETIDSQLKSELGKCLRIRDEALVLPGAYRSAETGCFKNVTFRLAGDEAGLDTDIFSPNWFAGVSAIPVPQDSDLAKQLADPEKRRRLMDRLRSAICSEIADPDVLIGPGLDCDRDERDTDEWTAGFDGPSCAVGIYSAAEMRTPYSTSAAACDAGLSRLFDSHYLVVKAGGGVAASTFHSRLISSLRDGKTLQQALSPGGSPGAQALRRVAAAARRNRGRILAVAAEALGLLPYIDTLHDVAAVEGSSARVAITKVDVCVNSIRRLEDDSSGGAVFQYTSGVDLLASTGAATLSNLNAGMTLLLGPDANPVSIRNEAYCTIPFSSTRTRTSAATVAAAVAEQLKGVSHPDAAYISSTFVWRNKSADRRGALFPPPSLAGTHAPERFLKIWARELGLAALQAVHLRPRLVCVSGVENAKLRAALRRLEAA